MAENSYVSEQDIRDINNALNVSARFKKPIMDEKPKVRRVSHGTIRHKESDKIKAASYKDSPKLDIPNDINEEIDELEGYYYSDSLFGWMVDLTASLVVGRSRDWVNEIESDKESELQKAEDEEYIWSWFDFMANKDLDNVPMGNKHLDFILARNLILCEMTGVQYAFGEFKPPTNNANKIPYQFPVKIVDIHPSSIILRRESPKDGDEIITREEIYIRNPDLSQEDIKEGSEYQGREISADPKDNPEYTLLPNMSVENENGAYVIKSRWGYGTVKVKDNGKTLQVINGLYPTPSLRRAIPHLKMRKTLHASDLQTIDGIIKALLVWGLPETLEIRPDKKLKDGTTEDGTIKQIKKILEVQKMAGVMELLLPFGLKPEWITPPTDVLLNFDKYAQSTIEILLAFGIFALPKDVFQPQLVQFSMKSYKENISYYRRLIKSFWDRLAILIYEKNKGKLSYIPECVYSPIPFFEDNILTSADAERSRGTISVETYHSMLGLNAPLERQRLRREIKYKDIYAESVPVQFKQSVAEMDGSTSTEQKKKAGRPKDKVEKTNQIQEEK